MKIKRQLPQVTWKQQNMKSVCDERGILAQWVCAFRKDCLQVLAVVGVWKEKVQRGFEIC